MTFLELQTEVRENVIDLPTVVTNRVPTLVNRAYREVQQRHNFKIMEETQSYTTTVSTRTLGSVPSDFKEWRVADDTFPVYKTDDGVWYKLTFASQNAARMAFEESLDTGPPLVLIHDEPSNVAGASSVLVYPLPDGYSDYDNGEYRVYVPYWKYLPALSGDSDTTWLTDFGAEYIIAKATADGFLADWDEERMGIWRQLAEEKFDKLVKADKRLRVSGINTLIPHFDVNEPTIRM